MRLRDAVENIRGKGIPTRARYTGNGALALYRMHIPASVSSGVTTCSRNSGILGSGFFSLPSFFSRDRLSSSSCPVATQAGYSQRFIALTMIWCVSARSICKVFSPERG